MTDILFNLSTINFSSPLLILTSVTIGSSLLFNVLFNKKKTTTTREVETQTPRSDNLDFSPDSYRNIVNDLESLNSEYKETIRLLNNSMNESPEYLSEYVESSSETSLTVDSIVKSLKKEMNSLEQEYLTSIPPPDVINQATTNNTFDYIYDILWFPVTILKYLWG
jgi:hypothetical protein